MARSYGSRIGAFGLLAVLVGLSVAFLVSDSSGDAEAAPGGKRTPARQLLLSRSDLPSGYRYFSPDWDGQFNPNLTCAPLGTPDGTAALADWIEEYAPRGCYALFWRYRGDSEETFELIPPLIGSGALDAGSEEAAAAGFALAPELLTHALDVPLSPARPAPGGPGDEAAFVRFKSGLVDEVSGGSAKTSVLVWRSGDTLGAVLVGGLTAKADDRRALALAKRQQQLIP